MRPNNAVALILFLAVVVAIFVGCLFGLLYGCRCFVGIGFPNRRRRDREGGAEDGHELGNRSSPGVAFSNRVRYYDPPASRSTHSEARNGSAANGKAPASSTTAPQTVVDDSTTSREAVYGGSTTTRGTGDDNAPNRQASQGGSTVSETPKDGTTFHNALDDWLQNVKEKVKKKKGVNEDSAVDSVPPQEATRRSTVEIAAP